MRFDCGASLSVVNSGICAAMRLKASVEVYRTVRERSQVVRRTEAEEAVVAFLG